MSQTVLVFGWIVVVLGALANSFWERWKRESEHLKLEEYRRGWELGQVRNILRDRQLIEDARQHLWLLGFNALGPLHEGREALIALLRAGGEVRVLLISPKSDAFQKREKQEEEIFGRVTGRLRAEHAASLAICRDILLFAEGRGSFEVRLHSHTPKFALVFADPESPTGMLHYNIYPEDTHLRGYLGKHTAVPNAEPWREEFARWVGKYQEMWSDGEKVDIRSH
jgi:Domain of unknown function (DUF5919)